MDEIANTLRALCEDVDRVTEDNSDIATRLNKFGMNASARIFSEAAQRGSALSQEITALLDGD